MECSRCCLQPVIHAFTQANLDNSLGRMKTKEIIAAVNNLKEVFRAMCSRCQNMSSQTNAIITELKEFWNSKIQELARSISQDTNQMRDILKDLQEAFQTVCLTCAKVSNDDNPSNHGQSFVSLDSGNCHANSGKAKSTSTDDNIVQSRADWIGLHKSPDVAESTFGMCPHTRIMLEEDEQYKEKVLNDTTSMLPPEIEDRLRIEFSNFVELDIIDKLLLSCVMSGMNIAEFAKMLWFPYSIVDPKTRTVKPITKQAAHARWINICKRFPVFMSVAISSNKENKKAMAKLRKFIDDPNGDEAETRFQNGKMASVYAKAAKKAKEEYEKKVYDKEVKRKQRQEKKGEEIDLQNSKNKKEQCLPGLF